MKTILAYRFSAFGDVAMTVPVFREFLEQNKDVRIVMVLGKAFRDFLKELKELNLLELI